MAAFAAAFATPSDIQPMGRFAGMPPPSMSSNNNHNIIADDDDDNVDDADVDWHVSNSHSSSSDHVVLNVVDDDDDDDDDIGEAAEEAQRVRASASSRGPVARLRPQANFDERMQNVQDDQHVQAQPRQAPRNAAIAAEDLRDNRQRQDIRNCPLCWEEQPYVAADYRGRAGGTDRSAMLQKVQDFRKTIFRFEQMLSGRQNDETIFYGMLQLRRLFIESYLDEHGYRYRRWTMQTLREHYDPTLGHRFDPVRELNGELQDLRRMKRWTMQHAMFVPNPDTGEPMFNVRAVDTRLRVSKQYNDTLQKMHTELRRRDTDNVADSRMVLEAVNDAVNRLTGGNRAAQRGVGAAGNVAAAGGGLPGAEGGAIEDDPLANMYDIGGM